MGKSVGSAWALLHLARHYKKACYWKPVQAGLDSETDSEFVSRLCGDGAAGGNIQFLPCRHELMAALSPHEAARLDELTIELDDFNLPELQGEFCKAPLIVEGAGGVYVPLNPNDYMLDLMVRLQLPVIIVARTKLGTINHTLLTIKAVRAAGAEIAGVILNGAANDVNRHAIEHYGDIRILGEIPLLDELNAAQLLNIAPVVEVSDWKI